MYNNMVSSKTKLLVPTYGLIFILIFFGSIIVFFNYSKISSLNELNEKVLLSTIVSDVLHSLQKERGLSSGYVLKNSDKFKKDLILQRKKSNEYIKKLDLFLDGIKCEKFKRVTESFSDKLKTLKGLRKSIDKHNITYVKIIKDYSSINSSLLNIIVDITKEIHIPSILQNVMAYSNFLYFKEYAGLERAQGVVLLSSKELDKDVYIKFVTLMAVQSRHETMFLKYASKTIRDFYNQISKDHSFANVKLMRDVIVQDEFTKVDIDPKEWYNIITTKLNVCDRVSKFIEKDTTKKIDLEIKSSRTIFMVITILIFLSLIVFVFMLIAFLKLAKEEQRLRVVMDKYIISSITDLSGKIIDVSQAFCNISGYTKEELIGSAHNIVRHPDMPKEAFKELWRKIKKGESWSGKVKNLKKDGGFYWVYANIEPLFNSKGEIESYVSIRLDITENEILMSKIMEEEQKNKFQQEMIHKQSRLAQMGEMLSMIAHQWRQPLNAITAASAVINLKAKRHKLDESTAIELSDKIKEFSIHLSLTIDDFRNFFKSNKIREEVSYKQIVDDVLSICQSSLEDKGIDVIQEMNSEDIFLSYKNELKQVVLNLVKNAEDALIENNIEDPCIYIRADKNILSISDNAGGISKNILDKVFDPYFSTKTQKDGTGLGLYMSKMIVEDHCNGSLHVNNDKFGANFEIILGEDND